MLLSGQRGTVCLYVHCWPHPAWQMLKQETRRSSWISNTSLSSSFCHAKHFFCKYYNVLHTLVVYRAGKKLFLLGCHLNRLNGFIHSHWGELQCFFFYEGLPFFPPFSLVAWSLHCSAKIVVGVRESCAKHWLFGSFLFSEVLADLEPQLRCPVTRGPLLAPTFIGSHKPRN